MYKFSAIALPIILASAIVPNTALAAEGPGCFPELNWTEAFPHAESDPSNYLIEGEWEFIANGRRHTLEVLGIDAESRSFFGYYNGEAIQGNWIETERKVSFNRTHPDGKGGITVQNFVGYIMDVNPDDTKIRMAGTITREAPPATTYDHPDRLTYGFYATTEL